MEAEGQTYVLVTSTAGPGAIGTPGPRVVRTLRDQGQGEHAHRRQHRCAGG